MKSIIPTVSEQESLLKQSVLLDDFELGISSMSGRDSRNDFWVMELRPGEDRQILQTTSRALLQSIISEIEAEDPTYASTDNLADLASQSFHQPHGRNAVNNLRLRDLRRLEYLFSAFNEPAILVKRHAVLLIMDPIRAIITANRVIVMVPDGADSILSKIENAWILEDGISIDNPDQQRMNKADGVKRGTLRSIESKIAYESHAYEILLNTVLEVENEEYSSSNQRVTALLSKFSRKGSILPVELQEELNILKNFLAKLLTKVTSYKTEIAELLEDDERMALMNLTRLNLKPTLYNTPLSPEILSTHEEIEDLLELYLLDYSSLEAKVSHLQSQLQAAEDMILLRLDTARNELLIANTSLTVLSCSIAFGAYFTGIFGMNLDNTVTIQPISNVFPIVFVCSFAIMPIMYFVIMAYYKKMGVVPRRIRKK